MSIPSLEEVIRSAVGAPQPEILSRTGVPRPSPWSSIRGAIVGLAARLGVIYPDDGGLRLPRFSTAARDAMPTPRNGEVIWNTTTESVEVWFDSAWYTLWTVAENSSTGLSQVTTAATAIGPGEVQDFELPVPATFFDVNVILATLDSIVPGVGISSFDIALYDTPANAAAGTFNVADAGLQFLAPNLAFAAGGPGSERWSVLGRMAGSVVSNQPVVAGKIRNNDGANSFDLSLAIEAYGLRGERAV